MVPILDFIADFVNSVMWPLFAFWVFINAVSMLVDVFEGFIEGCREKPERADALAALIRAWLTK